MVIHPETIGIPNENTFRKFSIPPLLTRPRLKRYAIPSYQPSNMWLVKLPYSGSGTISNQYMQGFNPGIEGLRIQTVPMNLSVQPTSDWVVIPTVGRNNPFYHYMGGEDTLTFTLDWYTNRADNTDVIEKCRKVESWSKANGYLAEPPRVILLFGDLFREDVWIVASAQYELSLFNRGNYMMPCQAYQEIVLKKVTDKNTLHDDIKWQR